MSLEQWVASYGYYAIVAGTFLEGETILVIGGFLAHRGYLTLPGVVAAAFLGTLFGDQLYYYIGRLKGIPLLERRPAWKRQSERLLKLLRRHEVLLILGFRFLYGLRAVTPFLIGASGIAPLRYTVLNVIGAAVWAVAIGSAGYLVGQALELVLDEVRRYELWILAAIAASAAIAAIAWLVRRVRTTD